MIDIDYKLTLGLGISRLESLPKLSGTVLCTKSSTYPLRPMAPIYYIIESIKNVESLVREFL